MVGINRSHLAQVLAADERIRTHTHAADSVRPLADDSFVYSTPQFSNGHITRITASMEFDETEVLLPYICM